MSDSVNIEGIEISKDLAQKSLRTAEALLAVAKVFSEENPVLYLLGTAVGIAYDNDATREEVLAYVDHVFKFAKHTAKIERLVGIGPNLQVVPDSFPPNEAPTQP